VTNTGGGGGSGRDWAVTDPKARESISFRTDVSAQETGSGASEKKGIVKKPKQELGKRHQDNDRKLDVGEGTSKNAIGKGRKGR